MRGARGRELGLHGVAIVVAAIAMGEPGAGPLPRAEASEEPAPVTPEALAFLPAFAARPLAEPAKSGLTLTFRLKSGNRPPDDRPNAWVYLPSRFDPSRPLRVIVLFHGFKNCIRSYVSDEGKRCRIGGKVRTGYDVPAQIERSGTSSIVVMPEIAYDVRSSDPGVLGDRGGLRAFLTELIEKALAPAIGPRRFEEIERVALVASSGGYQALLPALAHGEVAAVRDVYLLDAMYVGAAALDGFLRERTADFRPDAARPRRFGMIYCEKGSGTLRESRELGKRVAGWMDDAGEGEWATFAPRSPDADVDDLRAPVVVIGTPLMHDKIVERYLWRFLAASGI